MLLVRLSGAATWRLGLSDACPKVSGPSHEGPDFWVDMHYRRAGVDRVRAAVLESCRPGARCASRRWLGAASAGLFGYNCLGGFLGKCAVEAGVVQCADMLSLGGPLCACLGLAPRCSLCCCARARWGKSCLPLFCSWWHMALQRWFYLVSGDVLCDPGCGGGHDDLTWWWRHCLPCVRRPGASQVPVVTARHHDCLGALLSWLMHAFFVAVFVTLCWVVRVEKQPSVFASGHTCSGV